MSSVGTFQKDEDIGAKGPTYRELFKLTFVKGTAQSCIYLGQYKFSQLPECKGLSVEEWKMLSDEVQKRWIDTITTRNRLLSRTMAAERFATGEEQVPLRLARCVGFNFVLYEKLKAAHASESTSSKKRGRVDDEDDADYRDGNKKASGSGVRMS